MPAIKPIGLKFVELWKLQRNIPPEMREGFTLLSAPTEIDQRQNFGLVVVDGKGPKSTKLDYLAKGAICFVDGNRFSARELILRGLAEKGLSCDFEYHSQRYRRFDWRRTASGIPYPRVNKALSPTRGCWIGKVH